MNVKTQKIIKMPKLKTYEVTTAKGYFYIQGFTYLDVTKKIRIIQKQTKEKIQKIRVQKSNLKF